MTTWRKTPKAGAKLTDIGKPLRSRARPPGSEPIKLAGSNKLSTFVVDRPPRQVVVEVCPAFEDRRFEAGPDAERFFAGTRPGIDPSTGLPWVKR